MKFIFLLLSYSLALSGCSPLAVKEVPQETVLGTHISTILKENQGSTPIVHKLPHNQKQYIIKTTVPGIPAEPITCTNTFVPPAMSELFSIRKSDDFSSFDSYSVPDCTFDSGIDDLIIKDSYWVDARGIIFDYSSDTETIPATSLLMKEEKKR